MPTAQRALAAGIVALYLLGGIALVSVLNGHGYNLAHFSVGTGGDAFEYNQLGLSLLEGDFTLGIAPEYFRTPGYPLLVAFAYATTHSLLGIVFLQILLVAASAWLIAKLGELLGAPRAGLVAGALYALDPSVFIGAFMTLSDISFVALLLLLCYLCSKPGSSWMRDAAYVGLGLGFLALIRPTGLFVIPFLAAWFAFARGGGMKRAVLQITSIIILSVAVLMPWMLRNHALAGSYAISSVAPYNFLFYNLIEYEAAEGEGTKDEIHARFMEAAGISDTRELRDLTYSPRFAAVAKEELAGRVPDYALFHIVKSVPFYIGSSIQAMERAFSIQGVLPGLQVALPNISGFVLAGRFGDALAALFADPLVLLERLFWLAVLCLDVAALYLARGKARLLLVFFALMALLFGALTGPVSFPRYRLPAEPFLLLSAAYAVSMGVCLWKKRS